LAPRKDIPSFRGAVQFLPAYPWDKGVRLETDILTSHHQEYYRNNPKYPHAYDDEDPIPVEFPSVAAGGLFAFVIQGVEPELTGKARHWLKNGLETLGIGAKTAAGYGWFVDMSEETAKKEISAAKEREAQASLKMELQKQAAKGEANRIKCQKDAEAMANMTQEQRKDYEVGQLTEDQFRDKLQKLLTLEKQEQVAVVRALFTSRSSAWRDVKVRAGKKKTQWLKIENDVRCISKKSNLGKLP